MSSAISSDRSWYITERWQQYAGERRANLLRMASIGTFYLIHLWHCFSSQGKLPDWGFLQITADVAVNQRFHLMVTLLALAWVMLAAAVHLCLRARVFPPWLPIVSTVGDLVFLTSLLSISTGPKSPLVAAYFLVIAMSALRFDLRLVRIATIGAMIGYICILGVAKWPDSFGREGMLDVRVPRYHQLITLAALGLAGIILGQVVRRVRHLAQEYAERKKEDPKAGT